MLMYDSVNVTEIPADAQAVAGYVNGIWPTYWTLATKFPHAHRLSIAVSANRDADCLDVEQGDATPAEAPWWVKRQLARGVKPTVYCSLSVAPTVLLELRRHGIQRSQIKLWTAHYTDRPHRCSPRCQFGMWTLADATQYTQRALGRNLDASLVSDSFFPQSPLPVGRAVLRARILYWRRHGMSWARIKATSVWRRFRALGGK